MLEIIKTNDGYMVQTADGDYLCDANGDNLWDTHEEAEAVLSGAPKLKTYKVWVKNVSYLYAYVEAESHEQAWDLAGDMDGSDFIDSGHGDWDLESTEEVTP